MKKLSAIALALASLVAALPAAQPAAGPDIRLVLLIAVDQFRYDYLTRFRTGYTDGFKRLLTEGAVFTNANLEHYPTVTAIGHATMLSGATPSVQRNHRQRLVRSGNGQGRAERLGSHREAGRIPDGVRGVAPAAPGEHAGRRAEDGVAAAQGGARRAARVRRVLERPFGHPARRPRRRRRRIGGTRRPGASRRARTTSPTLRTGCGRSTTRSRRTRRPAGHGRG